MLILAIILLSFHYALCFQSWNILAIKINNKSTKNFFPFGVGMVPEQAGEVSAKRAELGDEPRRLYGQRDGGRVTVASHQSVASLAT